MKYDLSIKECKMKLLPGDKVASKEMTVGKYLGLESIQERKFHKIYDNTNKLTIFVPENKIEEIRKLPTRSSIQNELKIFKKFRVIDAGEIDGSRFQYFKEKISLANFKNLAEVFHDLSVLKRQKKISISEKKMWQRLKDLITSEVSYVLDEKAEKVEEMISFPSYS